MLTTAGIVAGICAGLAYVVGGWLGYERGVRETEQRWSEAVAKADYDRRYGKDRTEALTS